MSTVMVPASKPKMTQQEVIKSLQQFDGFPSPVTAKVFKDFPVRLLGARGYYKKTMGNPLTNDINIYDDAVFIVSPDGFASFNFNTDPSVKRKGVATLVPNQVIWYKVGMHGISGNHPYLALRQSSPAKFTREGVEGILTDKAPNFIFSDIHPGGINTTSSLACQTVVRAQWDSFFILVQDMMTRYKQTLVPYALIEL